MTAPAAADAIFSNEELWIAWIFGTVPMAVCSVIIKTCQKKREKKKNKKGPKDNLKSDI